MSGPATRDDENPASAADTPSECEVEILQPRHADVGGFGVERVLPRRGRRMVGAWCFVDHLGPGDVDTASGLDVGPHPHIGLQTVTWLVEGALLHRDSLGSEQVVRPGQLNLMTAGHGVSHAEETRGVHTGRLYGVQLWVAQPAATRDGAPAFEHHAELPQVPVDGSGATVLVGTFADATSPARHDTDHLGVEVSLRPGRTNVPLVPRFEHAILALGFGVTVGGRPLPPGHLGYLGVGRDELAIDADQAARVLLIGGEPFDEELLMWWNYVARSREEIVAAHEEWTHGGERFGTVRSPLPRIDATGPPWPGAR